MSRFCRLGEYNKLQKDKRKRNSRKLREFVNKHILDEKLNKEFHDLFNKVLSD